MTGDLDGKEGGAITRFIKRWRKVGVVAAVIALCEIGARIALPGVSNDRLREVLQNRSNDGLMGLYNLISGGALSRGAILALGVVPYLSARVIMRLAREAIPEVTAAWQRDEHRKLRRWTRVLTGGLALVQSYGFALFLQRVQGVVADPGPGFTARTMFVLTAGALGVMWLGERFFERTDDSADQGDPESADSNDSIASPSHQPLLGEAAPDFVAATRTPSKEGVPGPL